MGQLLGLVVLTVIAKLAWDSYKEHQVKNKRQGKVIDLSNAWVDLNDMPYRKRAFILNARELAAFRLLSDILQDRYVIFPKVRLADLLSMPADAPRRQEYMERIKDRRVDFVICATEDLEPLLVVLARSASDGKKKSAGERFTLRTLEAAGLSYTSMDVSSLPGSHELVVSLQEAGLAI